MSRPRLSHFTGGCVGLRAGLERCGKSRSQRDSIPGPSSSLILGHGIMKSTDLLQSNIPECVSLEQQMWFL
jgi:hypothetical protein